MHQVHQQGGDERPVHHQPRVTFDLSNVLAVVVDAVPVEGEGAVAKEQHVIWPPLLAPNSAGGGSDGWRRHIGGLLRIAVNDVVELGDGWGRCAIAVQLMSNFNENEFPGAAFFHRHVVDGRCARHHVAHPHGAVEIKLAASPHPPGQRHWRQETTALGVAVGANVALAMQRQEVKPMPEQGQGGADGHRRGGVVQRGGQCSHGGGSDGVVDGLGATNPGA